MKKGLSIDLLKMALYVLKRWWLLVICAAVGFGGMYWRSTTSWVDTYTASGTMYVYNGNPNMVNYQYTSVSDLNSAVELINTYSVVIRSNKVLDAVVEQLLPTYPGIQPRFISASLSMGSVQETGVVRVSCTTVDAKMSADICNAVLDVAPEQIKRVVGAGGVEVIDYADVPLVPNSQNLLRKGIIGALIGFVFAAGLLAVIYLVTRKIDSARELEENYTLPVLAEVPRDKRESSDPGRFLLNEKSSVERVESYAKLRMNLLYSLVGKDSRVVMVTSAVSGEGKSTVTANLAISCAMSDRKVLLIDADMRRASQKDVFHYDSSASLGLSDVLAGNCAWKDALLPNGKYSLDILPVGHIPPNPSQMLESDAMRDLLKSASKKYDLILIDTPPINIVSDPLALSSAAVGSLFVVRQNFSDHREIRKALVTAEMTGMNILGFVFYGENLKQGSYYSRRHYQNYYHAYDKSRQPDGDPE